MNDDVILQPGEKQVEPAKPKTNWKDVESQGEDSDSNSPAVFDFSSDFNISPVKEDRPANPPPSAFKPITVTPPPRPAPYPKPNPSPAAPSPVKTPQVPPAAAPVSMPIPKIPEPVAKPPIPPFKPAETETPAPEQKYVPQKSSMQPIAGSFELPRSMGQAAVRSVVDAIPSQRPVQTPIPAPTPFTPKPFSPTSESKKPETPAEAVKPSLNKLDTQWPFASAQTIASRDAIPRDTGPSNAEPRPVDTAAPANPVPVPANLPGENVTGQSGNPVLKNLRTYEGDVAEVLAHRGTSRVAMSLAQSKREGLGEVIKSAPEPRPSVLNIHDSPKTSSGGSSSVTKLIIILLCVILAGGGTLLGYYLYSQSVLGTRIPVVQRPKAQIALVPFDSQAVIAIDNLNSVSLSQKIKAEIERPLVEDKIKEIVLIQKRDGADYRVSGPEAITALNVPVPDIILRTLKPQWMLGTYVESSGQKTPFVLLSTNLFQNAFAGMLDWEPTIPDVMAKNFGIGRQAQAQGTSTSQSAPIAAYQGQWRDQIVKNKDVRSFVTTNGVPVLSYAFIDNETIVIAGSNGAIAEIVERLEDKAYLR